MFTLRVQSEKFRDLTCTNHVLEELLGTVKYYNLFPLNPAILPTESSLRQQLVHPVAILVPFQSKAMKISISSSISLFLERNGEYRNIANSQTTSFTILKHINITALCFLVYFLQGVFFVCEFMCCRVFGRFLFRITLTE